MQRRLMWCGSLNPNVIPGDETMPPDAGYYDCARRYLMPPAGVCWHYPPRLGVHVAGYVKGCTCGRDWNPKGQDWSLLVIEDFFEKYDDPASPVKRFAERMLYASDEDEEIPIDETGKTQKQHTTGRATDLAQKWANYGVVVIAGERPTDEELARARQARDRFARRYVQDAEASYSRYVLHGAKAGNDFCPAARMWAAELGVMLKDSVDRMPKAPEPAEMMLCPFCREEIRAGAIKCKHCGSMLEGDPAGKKAK